MRLKVGVGARDLVGRLSWVGGLFLSDCLRGTFCEECFTGLPLDRSVLWCCFCRLLVACFGSVWFPFSVVWRGVRIDFLLGGCDVRTAGPGYVYPGRWRGTSPLEEMVAVRLLRPWSFCVALRCVSVGGVGAVGGLSFLPRSP